MQKILLMSALLLLMVGCSDKKEATAKTAQSTETAETATAARGPLEERFVSRCAEQDEGKEKDDLLDREKVCQCGWNSIMEKYSLEQMMSMDSTKKTEFEEDTKAAAMACAVKFLKGEL